LYYLNYIGGFKTVSGNFSSTERNFDIVNYRDCISVMTYNIRYAYGLDQKQDLNRIAENLQGHQIIALNEVDMNLYRSDFVNQSEELCKKLSLNYVFGPAMSTGRGSYGNALLTYFPIIKKANHKLPVTPGKEPRSMLEVLLKIGENEKLNVFVTHLSPDKNDREIQLLRVKKIVKNSIHPFILMGDFNQEKIYIENTNIFSENSKTYPANSPQYSLDHIMGNYKINTNINMIKLEYENKIASDHLPISLCLFK
ncbi:MAG: endonuclease/exonuclease/phosphatase family protein, partial [Bacillota bacterium]